LLCERCQQPGDENQPPAQEVPLSGTTTVCMACKKTFDGSFNYCPHCGQRA
jgi:predicted amidophosphoribosyltransferase